MCAGMGKTGMVDAEIEVGEAGSKPMGLWIIPHLRFLAQAQRGSHPDTVSFPFQHGRNPQSVAWKCALERRETAANLITF